MGKKLFQGFRIRYGIKGNVGIHKFRHRFTFANLEKQIGIIV